MARPDPMVADGRWTIWTEREKECARVGFGADSFHRTLRHLRDRGDHRARVQTEGSSEISDIQLRSVRDRP